MPRRLAEALEAWELRDPVALGDGEVALVFGVTTSAAGDGDGDGDAVLKLSPVTRRDVELCDEHRALALWAADGAAPPVLRTRDGGLTMLLRRVRPGENLRGTTAGAEEIVTVLGALARRVHVAVPNGAFAALADAPDAAGWRAALTNADDRDELDRLLAPRAEDRLLHLDLHWLNALRAGTGWVAIDPKPRVGDPCAEVFAFLDGPPLTDIPAGRTAARDHVKRLIAIYAIAAALDGDRVARWLRLRAIVYAAESDATGVRAQQLTRLVEALA